MSLYQTIKAPSEGSYKEKGSKFLAFAIPVSDEDEIKLALDDLKQKYFDARHVCYAYLIGLKEQKSRSNDDGEPNHSAGDPILGQIKSFGLTNVLVAVVRYFGGTKLGVGGLISAYKTSAEEALRNAQVLDIYDRRDLILTFDYEETTEVERLLKDFNLDYVTKEYTDDCRFQLAVVEDQFDRLVSAIEQHHKLKLELPY